MARADEIATLVETHGAWLSALLRGLTRREVDAEDAFQDVWMRLIKLGGLPKGASPRAYLATIARSVVIDRHRREGREEPGEIPDEEVDEATPAERFEARASREEILAAVRALPMGPRAVVLMRIEAELTFREIADRLGVPLGTVLTWMRASTTKLKKALGLAAALAVAVVSAVWLAPSEDDRRLNEAIGLLAAADGVELEPDASAEEWLAAWQDSPCAQWL